VDGADGVEGVDGVLVPPPPPPVLAGFGFFFCFCDGSEPDGENEASCGGSLTAIGVTADGAAAFESFDPVALPIANAAPNATTTAATAMAAKRPCVMTRRTSRSP
jgi:hypothetical protein